jgi:hypothetical protein
MRKKQYSTLWYLLLHMLYLIHHYKLALPSAYPSNTPPTASLVHTSWTAYTICASWSFSIMPNTTYISKGPPNTTYIAPPYTIPLSGISPRNHLPIWQNFSNGFCSAAVMRPNFSSTQSSSIININSLH